jgi:pyridoxine 5-phosphate synthase
MRVSMFIDADIRQLEASKAVGAAVVELHTGAYAHAKGAARKAELKRLQQAAKAAAALGLECHAGHGLTYDNVGPIAAIPEVM